MGVACFRRLDSEEEPSAGSVGWSIASLWRSASAKEASARSVPVCRRGRIAATLSRPCTWGEGGWTVSLWLCRSRENNSGRFAVQICASWRLLALRRACAYTAPATALASQEDRCSQQNWDTVDPIPCAEDVARPCGWAGLVLVYRRDAVADGARLHSPRAVSSGVANAGMHDRR